MDWTQVLAIIGTLVGAFFYLHADMNTLKNELHQMNMRLDQKESRVDRLYEMFIDLLKEKK